MTKILWNVYEKKRSCNKAHLKPSPKSTIELFCEKREGLKAVNCYRKKAPLKIFDCILKMSLTLSTWCFIFSWDALFKTANRECDDQFTLSMPDKFFSFQLKMLHILIVSKNPYLLTLRLLNSGSFNFFSCHLRTHRGWGHDSKESLENVALWSVRKHF